MQTMYCTLHEARRETRATNASAGDDALLLTLIAQNSSRFARLAGLDFEPRRETRVYAATPERVETTRRLFWLDRPLLDLVSVTRDDAALALGTGVAGWRESDDVPYAALRLVPQGETWYTADPDAPDTVRVTGVWGWRERYAERGWLATGDIVANVGGLDAATTTLTVTDADGADAHGFIPRFSPGQLLRVGAEFLRVAAVNTVTNTLTVLRGQRGTTASAHAQNALIEAWQVEDDVRRALARWTAHSYATRGVFETARISGLATVTTPPDMPAEVRAVAQSYAYA
jgi:hypothetical protein